MKKDTAAIALDGLTKQFGHLTALNNVSLSLPWGSQLALFGRNGAGKTTLLRIIASLLKQNAGTIHFDGEDVTHKMDRIRRHIGYISHQPMFYGDLTALENLRFYARLYGIPDREHAIRTGLERTGMALWAESPVRSFSRGMQQRLAVTRAFLHEPRLLLLDEPFSGLDQGAVRLLKIMLGEYSVPSHSIILTTHQLREGWEVADRIAVLEKGKLSYMKMKPETDFDSFKAYYEELQP